MANRKTTRPALRLPDTVVHDRETWITATARHECECVLCRRAIHRGDKSYKRLDSPVRFADPRLCAACALTKQIV